MAQKFRRKFQKEESLSVAEAFDRFIKDKRAAGLTEKTLTTYRAHFQAVCRFKSADGPMIQVTRADLSDLISDMAETGLSRNSIRSYTATLKSFFSWAREHELTDVVVPLFKGVETVPETYTAAELQRLLRHPSRGCSWAEMRNWCIVCLLVNNGIRASTVRAIKIGDVDLDNSVIVLRHMKSGRLQSIPLGPEIIKALEEYLAEREGDPDDYLFCDVSGRQMSEVCLHSALERYNQSRGVKKTGIHKYRHTFARMYLVDCGGDSLKLQRLLGHSTLEMTKRYARIFDRDLVDDFQNHSPLEKIKKGRPEGRR